MTATTSLFRAQLDETAEETHVKTNDFGLKWLVQVLPGDARGHGFLRVRKFIPGYTEKITENQ